MSTERLLLHVCCGPCAMGAVPFWQAQVQEVRGFFYNPNIHPFLEYRRRLAGAHEAAEALRMPLTSDESYDPAAWFAEVDAGAPGRCERCIRARLRRAAQEAAVHGYDAFSTTLSISPWQDHEAIVSEGALAAQQVGVRFVYQDLRSLYPESKSASRTLGLYRQKYCGCLLSEWERYRQAGGASGPS